MRAVVHDRYGPPEVLHIDEVARPAPKDDELLVRVQDEVVSEKRDLVLQEQREPAFQSPADDPRIEIPEHAVVADDRGGFIYHASAHLAHGVAVLHLLVVKGKIALLQAADYCKRRFANGDGGSRDVIHVDGVVILAVVGLSMAPVDDPSAEGVLSYPSRCHWPSFW